jgi:hypothetical protein
MSGFVTCAGLETALAAKQDKLTNCAGAPLVGPVPTCTEMAAAITAAATPDATTVVKGKVELATVAEAVAGTDSERAVTPEGLKAAIDAGVTAAIASMQDVFNV